jgi:hypothetical protein
MVMNGPIYLMSGFFEELQRRKVYRVAAAYIVAAGFLIQIPQNYLIYWLRTNWPALSPVRRKISRALKHEAAEISSAESAFKPAGQIRVTLTGGGVAVAVLQTRATAAIDNLWRVIATVHIILSLLLRRVKEASSVA